MLNTPREGGNVTALAHRTPRYEDLLQRMAPSVIQDEDENEKYIHELEQLERKSPHWTSAERKLADLLTLLIHDFEERHYTLKPASPVEVLRELMAANNLKQKDMVRIFGAESTVSSVLNGKRKMTTGHIQKLSSRFKVSPELFF